ncbi:hypothetical protein [Nostoc sp. DSM 114167]|uniref:hypothetical protein n=1 Tax=Nostoc sp. DSM 114167 TaxID=3439050 RepID=UPI004045CF59
MSGNHGIVSWEAIAQIKEQHRHELERLEQELKVGLLTEASARAEAQVQEQIQSLQNLYKQQKEQNIQLQQRLDEMESLRQLETENQQLRQRIQDLENTVEQRPSQQWGNTMTQQATKVLNKQVKLALEKTIDLRSLILETYDPQAQDPAVAAAAAVGQALINAQKAASVAQKKADTVQQEPQRPSKEDDDEDINSDSDVKQPPTLFPFEQPPQLDR